MVVSRAARRGKMLSHTLTSSFLGVGGSPRITYFPYYSHGIGPQPSFAKKALPRTNQKAKNDWKPWLTAASLTQKGSLDQFLPNSQMLPVRYFPTEGFTKFSAWLPNRLYLIREGAILPVMITIHHFSVAIKILLVPKASQDRLQGGI